LLERFLAAGTNLPMNTLPDLSVAAVDLDRAVPFLHAIATLKQRTPWIDAARGFANGNLNGAAETYARIGSRPDTAYARLRAARALVEQGRPAAADAPLQEALAFHRSVGANYFVMEAEALLAASA
jgi:hypothetical protein